jgi:hypothetical protein
VVKVTTNLIVYSGLGSEEKLKLTTKLDVKTAVFFGNMYLKTTLSKINKKK